MNYINEIQNKLPNIVGVKVSRTDWKGWSEYLQLTSQVAIFVGADEMCLSLLVRGVHGIISGAANILPILYVRLYESVMQGRLEAARYWQELIDDLCAVCHFGNPLAFIKEGVSLITSNNIDAGQTFSPLRALRRDEGIVLEKELQVLARKANTYTQGGGSENKIHSINVQGNRSKGLY